MSENFLSKFNTDAQEYLPSPFEHQRSKAKQTIRMCLLELYSSGMSPALTPEVIDSICDKLIVAFSPEDLLILTEGKLKHSEIAWKFLLPLSGGIISRLSDLFTNVNPTSHTKPLLMPGFMLGPQVTTEDTAQEIKEFPAYTIFASSVGNPEFNEILQHEINHLVYSLIALPPTVVEQAILREKVFKAVTMLSEMSIYLCTLGILLSINSNVSLTEMIQIQTDIISTQIDNWSLPIFFILMIIFIINTWYKIYQNKPQEKIARGELKNIFNNL